MELPVDSRATFAFSFSPDGTLIASTHGDHKIYVSQVDTRKVIYVLEGHPRTPWCVAWHPDPKRKLLASGCLGGVTIVWQLGVKTFELNVAIIIKPPKKLVSLNRKF